MSAQMATIKIVRGIQRDGLGNPGKGAAQTDDRGTRLWRCYQRGDGNQDHIHEQTHAHTPAQYGNAELTQGFEVDALKPHGSPP